MKIQLRPVKPAAIAKVVSPKTSKKPMVERSYQHLVTSQGVSPDRAKQLLGLT